MIVAFLIVMTASMNFPFYLIPVSLLLLVVFIIYLFSQITRKGLVFVLVIFALLMLNIIILIWIGIQNLIALKGRAPRYFYNQKVAFY